MTDADKSPDDSTAELYDSSAELEDDGVLDAADTLEGNLGDDPLDQGIVAPDRWSAGQRYGTTPNEERAGESLDQLLAEEEPDLDPYAGDELLPSEGVGEEEADVDVDGLLLDDGADPRAGRLVAEDEGAHADEEADLVARDVGIDAGAASAEEAAMHVVDDDDRDIRSDG
jgi:hypothetical protein